MVRRRLLLPALAGLLAFAVAAPARASLLPPKPPPSSQPAPPPSGDTNTSSGGPAYGHVRHCSLYATASSFGLSCVTGADRAHAKTVKEVLGHDKAPACWDEAISADDQVAKYGLPAAPEGTAYYLHYCISDLDLNAPVQSQHALQLNLLIIEIPTDAPPCPSPQPPDQQGRCVMTLTENQQAVVEMSAFGLGQIPPIGITTDPSGRVRSNQEVTFRDSYEGGATETAKVTFGAVRMWAKMNAFSIQPYGPGTEPKIPCDLSAPGGPSCTWAYPKSSAQQPRRAYPFRAEADWTVYVDDGAGPHAFATFRKYDDLPMPVFDVQTLVVH
jgi:hypothetical protein